MYNDGNLGKRSKISAKEYRILRLKTYLRLLIDFFLNFAGVKYKKNIIALLNYNPIFKIKNL